MSNAKPTSATAEQILLRGHIAAAIRQWLAENHVSIPELNHRMGRVRSSPQIYQTLNCKNAPGPTFRAKLSAVTGIPETDLIQKGRPMAVKANAVTVYRAPVAKAQTAPRDVLSFVVDTESTARIKLDATLPLTVAMPLLRMLLDAGLIFNNPE